MPDNKPPPIGVRLLEKQMDELARQIAQLAADDPKRGVLMDEIYQLSDRARKLKGEKR